MSASTTSISSTSRRSEFLCEKISWLLYLVIGILIIERSREDLSHISISSYSQSHSGSFDSCNSTHWRGICNWNISKAVYLDTEGDVLGVGLDTITLENANATVSLEAESQALGTLSAHSSQNNSLSLIHHSSNFSSCDYASPSFLATSKSESLIPSLSWSYTASAAYWGPHSRMSSRSSTLGEYDSSRFMPSSVSFPIVNNTNHALEVRLQSIEVSRRDDTTISLLPSPIVARIDSTVPHIWLPPSACEAFEEAFGIKWDDGSQLYSVDPKTHLLNSAEESNITFTLTDSGSPKADLLITFPYASFDLEVAYPLVDDSTQGFPLRRALNASQYTLGRTFLQEA